MDQITFEQNIKKEYASYQNFKRTKKTISICEVHGKRFKKIHQLNDNDQILFANFSLGYKGTLKLNIKEYNTQRNQHRGGIRKPIHTNVYGDLFINPTKEFDAQCKANLHATLIDIYNLGNGFGQQHVPENTKYITAFYKPEEQSWQFVAHTPKD